MERSRRNRGRFSGAQNGLANLIGKAHQFAPVPAQAKTRCAGRWRPPGRPVHPSFATDRSSDLSRRPRAFAAPPSSTCAPRASHTVVEATPSTASERGPFDRTLVRRAERAHRDPHEARERLQPAREPFTAVSAPQHRHRSCRDTARTPSRASPASTTTALEPTRTARLRAREVVRWAPATEPGCSSIRRAQSSTTRRDSPRDPQPPQRGSLRGARRAPGSRYRIPPGRAAYGWGRTHLRALPPSHALYCSIHESRGSFSA